MDRAQRKAAEQAKLAAMPVPRRLLYVVAGVVAAFGAATAVQLLTGDGLHPVRAAVIAVVALVVLTYMYVVKPGRS